jgi:superfamily II DNA or RNA helicase
VSQVFELRDYQRKALDAVHGAEFRGLSRVLVVKPTGAGKTVTFAHLIHERGGRAVDLAPRDELVRQAAGKIQTVTGERPGIVKAEQDEYRARVVVASVQTLARPSRLRRLLGTDGQSQLFHDTVPFSTVIVDEAHHYVAGEESNTFGRVLEGLGCFREGGPLTVGFTATPERGDGAALGTTWQEIVFSLSILDGIRGQWLTNIRGKQVKLRADFSSLHVRAGEFRDDEAAALLMEADAPKHAAEAYLAHAKDRRTLVFTPTIAVARAMAEAFRAVGVPSEHVDGVMPLDERRAVLCRLSTGETLVVPNAQVLTEGFDEPSVSCVIMARPTRSRPFAIQCIGRGLRPYPGKADCLVIDLVGHALRQDLVTVATLFDVSPESAERGVLGAVEAAGAGASGEVVDGHLVAEDVDILAARPFAWVTVGPRFVLRLGDVADLVLQPAEEVGQWDVFRIVRKRVSAPGTVSRYSEDRVRMFAGLDVGYAMGAAEDYARKSPGAVLIQKDAGWRSHPASPGQIAALGRSFRLGMTKGEASDLMNARGARRAYGQQARRA